MRKTFFSYFSTFFSVAAGYGIYNVLDWNTIGQFGRIWFSVGYGMVAFFTLSPTYLSLLLINVAIFDAIIDSIIQWTNEVPIQLRKMNIIPLVNIPYVNEVTLNRQNL